MSPTIVIRYCKNVRLIIPTNYIHTLYRQVGKNRKFCKRDTHATMTHELTEPLMKSKTINTRDFIFSLNVNSVLLD